MIRKPLVAGQFYPADPGQLKDLLSEFMPENSSPHKAFLAVAPHAGYVYSGRLAGQVLGGVEVPPHVLLIGPNHRGTEAANAALADYQAWQMPLGQVPTDTDMQEKLLAASPLLKLDNRAHIQEHSLEVMLPFLQFINPRVKICALSLGMLSWPQVEELALALAATIGQLPQPALILASTDMSHYLNAREAARLDKMAIEKILAMDPRGLYQVVAENHISMCGMLAVSLGLKTALLLGAGRAELVGYTNSGVVSNDFRQVVGYAGVIAQ